MGPELVIDKELESLLPPLSHEELSCLEDMILKDNQVNEPIVVWGDVIVDGYNRYRIAKKHGLNFEIRRREFADKDAVKAWMLQNQLGRRNLDGMRLQMARAEAAKTMEGKKEEVAAALNVSPRTLRHNAETERIVEQLPDDLSKAIKNEEIKATAKDLRTLAMLPKDQQEDVLNSLRKTKDLKETLLVNRSGITEDDINFLETIFQPETIRLIRSGGIAVRAKEIAKLRVMKPEKQQLISMILFNQKNNESLADAVKIADTSFGSTDDRLVKSREAITRKLDSLIESIVGYGNLSNKDSQLIVSSIKDLVVKWL